MSKNRHSRHHRHKNYGAGKAYHLSKGKRLSHVIFASRGGIRL